MRSPDPKNRNLFNSHPSVFSHTAFGLLPSLRMSYIENLPFFLLTPKRVPLGCHASASAALPNESDDSGLPPA